MLNPKDISEKRFERAARGYRAEEVDTFLKEVAFSYANMIKDYEQNEEKIVKLVDKINEYREDEDAIKLAILGAQKQGKQVIYEAEIKAEQIVTEAKDKSEKVLDEIRQQYSDEIAKLDNLKKEVASFKSNLTELYNKQLRLIMEIPDFEEDVDINEEKTLESEQNYDEEVQETISENNINDETEKEELSDNNFPYNNKVHNSNQSRFDDLRFGNKNK